MRENKKRNFNQITKENGITLIALMVIIIILIILSAITIRGITGNNGLIDQTEVSAENYKIQGYGEQIDQNVRATILSYSVMGEEARLTNIADNLRDETEWVKSAEVNEGETIGDGDILVTTHEGYVYQVYYNSDYGTVKVEFLGKDDGIGFPTIKARYERSLALIYAEAHDDSGIAKIELIYKEEIKGTVNNPTGEVEFDASKLGTGWYKLKATANTGKYRYAWVRVTNVTDKLKKPIITYNPAEPNGKAGWYTSPVQVTISTDSVAAKYVHYILSGANVAGGDEGVIVPLTEGANGVKSISFMIGEGEYSRSGVTTAVAWTEDEKGLKCKEDAIEDVKFDNVKPQITSAVVNATKGKDREGKDTGWIVSKGTIEINRKR